MVYEGVWQGATVAVKFTIAEKLDTSAYELLFSKILSHPVSHIRAPGRSLWQMSHLTI